MSFHKHELVFSDRYSETPSTIFAYNGLVYAVSTLLVTVKASRSFHFIIWDFVTTVRTLYRLGLTVMTVFLILPTGIRIPPALMEKSCSIRVIVCLMTSLTSERHSGLLADTTVAYPMRLKVVIVKIKSRMCDTAISAGIECFALSSLECSRINLQ